MYDYADFFEGGHDKDTWLGEWEICGKNGVRKDGILKKSPPFPHF